MTAPRKIKSLNDLAWWAEVGAAQAGYPIGLAQLLRDPKAAIPQEAREYLAAIVEGSVPAPVRDTRSKMDPRMKAHLENVIRWDEELRVSGRLSGAEARQRKRTLIAAMVREFDYTPASAAELYRKLARQVRPEVIRMDNIIKEHRQQLPQRRVFRNGKLVSQSTRS